MKPISTEASDSRISKTPTGGTHPGNPPGPERLLQFAWGFAPSMILGAALKFHLFDLLEEAPATVEELSIRTGASQRGLTAILNVLTSLGILTRSDSQYHLTPESSAFLVSGKPTFHGAYLEDTINQVMEDWLRLPEAVRTGRPVMAANLHTQGAHKFTQFVESFFPISYQAATMVGKHLGVSKVTAPISVVDIGAGSGVWGIALAQQSPWVRVRAVDLPRVLDVTKDIANRHGVGDRLSYVPGDLLEADFGSGHQVATIGHIFHREGRERSRQLLRKTFVALAPGGTIVISEFIPGEEQGGSPVALGFAIKMLLDTENAGNFSYSDLSEWLLEAGFRNRRLLDAPVLSPLFLATKP